MAASERRRSLRGEAGSLAALATCVAAGLAGVTYWKGALWSPFLVDAGPSGARSWPIFCGPPSARRPGRRRLGLGLLAAALARGHGATSRLACRRRWSPFVGVSDLAWNHRNLNPTAPRMFFTSKPEVVASIDQKDFGRLFVYDYTMDAGPERAPPGTRAPTSSASRDGGPTVGRRLRPADVPRSSHGRGVGALRQLREGLARPPAETPRRAERGPRPCRRHARWRLASCASAPSARCSRSTRTASTDSARSRRCRGRSSSPCIFSPCPYPSPELRRGRRAPRRRADALEALIDAGFDPEAEVVLSGDGDCRRAHRDDFAGRAESPSMGPDRVVVEAQANAPAHLVLVDAYDPGWRATVDGRPSHRAPRQRGLSRSRDRRGSPCRGVRLQAPVRVWGLWLSGTAPWSRERPLSSGREGGGHGCLRRRGRRSWNALACDWLLVGSGASRSAGPPGPRRAEPHLRLPPVVPRVGHVHVRPVGAPHRGRRRPRARGLPPAERLAGRNGSRRVVGPRGTAPSPRSTRPLSTLCRRGALRALRRRDARPRAPPDRGIGTLGLGPLRDDGASSGREARAPCLPAPRRLRSGHPLRRADAPRSLDRPRSRSSRPGSS